MLQTADVFVRLSSGPHSVEFRLGSSYTFDQVYALAHSDPSGRMTAWRRTDDLELYALAAALRRAENELRVLCGLEPYEL